MSPSLSLLNHAMKLHHRFDRPPEFNLFTILRNPGDEVGLHSRFLTALLSSHAHSLGCLPLEMLLASLDLESFSLEGVRVEREAFHIDILISNSKRQAIIIENKIYANDQPRQLERYYTQMRTQKYEQVHVCYLTLHGHSPTEDSFGQLLSFMEVVDAEEQFKVLGYDAVILPWLEQCIEHARNDAALRESLNQYHHLINQLTGRDMENGHLALLANELFEGDQILAAHDIRYAYDEALIQLQLQVWQDLEATIARRIPDLAHCSSYDYYDRKDLPRYCRQFIQQKRNNKWYGLSYKLKTRDIYVSLEIEDTIYAGIYCELEAPEEDRGYAKSCVESANWKGLSEPGWLAYSYPHECIDFKSPTKTHLTILTDPKRRQAYVDDLTNLMEELWKMLDNGGR